MAYETCSYEKREAVLLLCEINNYSLGVGTITAEMRDDLDRGTRSMTDHMTDHITVRAVPYRGISRRNHVNILAIHILS